MPEKYTLELERPARRALERLPPRAYAGMERAIDALADEPRPRGALKLEGPNPFYRVRVGEYRVIYAVFDSEKLIKVVRVVRRTSQTYRRLES